ncbi:carbohydrate-binding domain-containing protein [Acholeplasma sp. OttesenSCG-928-E16]|nr:carbohydrate-binding domain-containing protein [Acholeplasma sp. OttesenSCG-928-E16]
MKIFKMAKPFMIVLFFSLSLVFLAGCDFNGEWDHLGGGGTGEIQEDADTDNIENIGEEGSEIIADIDDNQTDTDYQDSVSIQSAMKIEESGKYYLSGNISGQINVKAENVHLILADVTITNLGKKVINSDYDLIITLADDTENKISNIGDDAAEANAISGSGNITINGGGNLSVFGSKSCIKADGIFYGLGGSLILEAGSGHGISADSIIASGIQISVNSAKKDALHAETDDSVLLLDPTFSKKRGFVYIAPTTIINVKNIYGDGIQADTFVLIDGGEITIHTLPTWVKATSADGCYKLSGGVYTKVAKDESTRYTSFFQLDQSCKGIKVGEIDYDDLEGVEQVIYDNSEYSLVINGGIINIDVVDDGLHTNSGDLLISGGTINISTSDDGIAADKNLIISDGDIEVSKSYEGIEAETISLKGGNIKITSLDDGINATNDESEAIQKQKCYIKISGGKIFVNSSGDGIDSNGGVVISGGEVYIAGPTSGADAALDSETGIIVSGGILVAAGSSGMVETPATNSTQYCVLINLQSSTSGKISVSKSSTTLLSFDCSSIFGSNKNYQSVVVSCPEFALGETFDITTGSKTTNVSISSIITKVGNSVGGGRPGGR